MIARAPRLIVPTSARRVLAVAVAVAIAVAIAVAAVVAAASGPRATAEGTFHAPPLSPRASAAEATITRDDLRALVGYLADDARFGRGVHHEGNAAAVAYAAVRFERAGVRPAGEGFLQPVPLHRASLGDDTRLELAASRARTWKAGDDFYPLAASPAADVSGPVVFADHRRLEAAPLVDGDDPDLTGRIVVVLERAAPASANRRDAKTLPEWQVESIARQATRAAALGAAALVVASPDRRLTGFRATWPSRPSVRDATYHLAVHDLPLPVVRVSARVAAALLDLDRRAFDALFDTAGPRPASADHELRLRLDIATEILSAPNVLAVVDGAAADGAADLVIAGAHLDHDGIDDGGTIYNGADDDASGVAAVIELAQAFGHASRQGWTPRRSILLALWNAEEKGLLGSTHFISHVVPAGRRPVAVLNLDMIGRREDIPVGNDPRYGRLAQRPGLLTRSWLHVVGYSYSPDLAGLVREEARSLGLSVREEYDDHPVNLLRRSDHWPFLRAGVPALFLTTGLHPDYHTPHDDVDDIDFDKLERITRLAFRAVWRLAEAVAIPRLAAAPTPEP